MQTSNPSPETPYMTKLKFTLADFDPGSDSMPEKKCTLHKTWINRPSGKVYFEKSCSLVLNAYPIIGKYPGKTEIEVSMYRFYTNEHIIHLIVLECWVSSCSPQWSLISWCLAVTSNFLLTLSCGWYELILFIRYCAKVYRVEDAFKKQPTSA